MAKANIVISFLLFITFSGCSSLSKNLASDDIVVKNAALKKYELGSLESQTKVINKLLESLWSPKPGVRLEGVRGLGTIAFKAEPAIPKLISAICDSDPDIRDAASEVLVQMGASGQPVVAELAQALRGTNSVAVSVSIANALGHIGPRAEQAVPSLMAALRSQYAQVRKSAANSLSNIGIKANLAFTELTIASIVDTDSNVRHAASSALMRIGSSDKGRDVPRFVAAMENISPQHQVLVANVLVKISSETALTELVRILRANDLTARKMAADAMIGIDARYAAIQFAKALNDPDVEVRRLSAISLGEMGPEAETAIPELAKALSDSDAAVRISAANSLSNIGIKANLAFTELTIASIVDTDSNVRHAASSALMRIGSSDKGRDVPRFVAAMENISPQHQVLVASVLVKISSKTALTELVRILHANDLTARKMAADAMIGIDVKYAAIQFAKALNDPDVEVRKLSAISLGEMRPIAIGVVDSLVAALSDSSESVRMAVSEALAKIGSDAIPALAKELNRGLPSRVPSAETLIKLDAKGIPALERYKNEKANTELAESVLRIVDNGGPSREGDEKLVERVMACGGAVRVSKTAPEKMRADLIVRAASEGKLLSEADLQSGQDKIREMFANLYLTHDCGNIKNPEELSDKIIEAERKAGEVRAKAKKECGDAYLYAKDLVQNGIASQSDIFRICRSIDECSRKCGDCGDILNKYLPSLSVNTCAQIKWAKQHGYIDGF